MHTKNNIINIFSLIVFFVLMCILRLWFSLFILFGLAILTTLLIKKRFYCLQICPAGSIQDYTAEDFKTKKEKKPNKMIKFSVFFIFWFYIGFVLYKSYYYPLLIWQNLLRFIIINLIFILFLQYRYSKRFWCKYLCPLGNLLDIIIKKLNNHTIKDISI